MVWRAGFVPRNCSGAAAQKPVPHTPVLRDARVRGVTARIEPDLISNESGMPPGWWSLTQDPTVRVLVSSKTSLGSSFRICGNRHRARCVRRPRVRVWRGARGCEVRAFRAALRSSSLARSRLSTSSGLSANAQLHPLQNHLRVSRRPSARATKRNLRREKTVPHTPGLRSARVHRAPPLSRLFPSLLLLMATELLPHCGQHAIREAGVAA
jgi:hypothetical protein